MRHSRSPSLRMGSLLTGLWLAMVSVQAQAAGYEIGTFYFPGWKDDQPGAPTAKPWQRLLSYPDKEPLLGWYREGDDDVARKQIDWMADYGLSFVVYDVFWSKDDKSFIEHAIRAYLRAPNRNRLKFALLWSNHNGTPQSQAQFEKMIDYELAQFMGEPEYLRIDGKPVFFLLSAALFEKDAKAFGKSPAELMKIADDRARSVGLPGIHFVAGTGADRRFLDTDVKGKGKGYQSVSTYNYQRAPGSASFTHGFAERDAAYRAHWQGIIDAAAAPLIVPMTSGWDKRPWGGSDDPRQDPSIATPDEFEAHLVAARRLMDSGNPMVRRMGVICCWNEFGEGSYIEPTKQGGFKLLERVKKVFASPPAK